MPAASSAAPEVRAALGRLRAAGEELRQRPRAQVIAALGALLEELRDPGSPIRRQLAGELPLATGFHPETLAEGRARGFEGWTASAFADLVAAELGSSRGVRSALGFPSTAVLLAGAIPMPTVLQLLATLALQSPVLVRPGSHDPVTARAVAEALQRLDPALGACLEVISFPHADWAAFDALAEAECVVATGSDETVAALARRARPWQRFVGYGHRLSVAAIGREGDLAGACDRMALDVALWDQLGCLSPVALYCVGWRWDERAVLLGQLESAFAQSQKRWPIGQIATREAAARVHEIATTQLRAAGGAEVELRSDPAGSWALVAERDCVFRGSPLHRFLRLHFVRDEPALVDALGPVASHLAAVGLGGFVPESARQLADRLARLGASRVCPIGEMQAPPIEWCHDGQGVLAPLARFADRGAW